jgi:hypothetical protein
VASGSVWAWGDNDRGQPGNGTRTNSEVPLHVEVPKGVSFVTVSSEGYTSYAIDRSDRLWAWGDNKSGQLGTGGSTTFATASVNVGIKLTEISSTAQNVAGFYSKPQST